MMFEYSYIKPRHQFGKQCVFVQDDNVAVEQIYPESELMQNYIIRLKRHRYTQTPHQFAAHEVQTVIKEVKNSGMLHLEGGWPKEIHPWDNEAMHRYRRRVERSDQWALSLKNLMPPMEHYILQNSAVNIYENFFDDMIPTQLTMEYSMRIRSAYEDPQENVRPIRQLSWSPNASNRLAAAYSFMEFDVYPTDANPYSYVWDIENPNKALAALKSSSPLMALEFNPRDPSLLISGLMSGQVCSWDIRTSDEPVQISLPSASHRRPTSQSLWITSKANTEFFSSAIDGTIMWWDTRYLKKPTDTLLMDLDDPARADILNAVGVTALQFEPTISSRFLVGTERGGVVNVNRKTNNPKEKLAARFECYTGPVVTIDRNPAFPASFLTIGDCTAKVWSDDTREGCLFRTHGKSADLCGGCWSKSRSSIFYTINTEGSLDAYDILTGVQAPLTSIHVPRKSLTAISAHGEGEFLAVGTHSGNIYIVECSEGMTTFSREDKAFLSAHLERCSRYEKMVDSRVKEIRLLRGLDQDESLRLKQVSIASDKRMHGKERRKMSTTKDKEKMESSRKSKRGKSRKRTTLLGGPEIAAAEEDYFRAIEAQLAKFEKIDPADKEAAQVLLKQREVLPEAVAQEEELEKSESKMGRKSTRLRRATRRMRWMKKRDQQSEAESLEEEASLEIDPELMKRRYGKKRATKILQKTCKTDVCKPEICCMDMEEKRRAKIQDSMRKKSEEEEEVREKRSVIVQDRWYRRLTEYVDQIPDRSFAFKKKMLLLKDLPPSILREELKEAKSEIRVWQERAIARKLSSWTIASKLEPIQPEEMMAAEEQVTETDAEAKASKTEDRKRLIFKRRSRKSTSKSRRVKRTPEEVEKEEEEQRLQELWRTLKQKLKEQEPRQKETYPRISAANPRRSSEDVGDIKAK